MVAIAPLKDKKVITKIEYSIPCLNLVMPEKENSHLINVRLIMNCPAQETLQLLEGNLNNERLSWGFNFVQCNNKNDTQKCIFYL